MIICNFLRLRIWKQESESECEVLAEVMNYTALVLHSLCSVPETSELGERNISKSFYFIPTIHTSQAHNILNIKSFLVDPHMRGALMMRMWVSWFHVEETRLGLIGTSQYARHL